jgi:hypothetical protein
MSETAPQHDYQAALIRIKAEYEARSQLESEIRPINHAALFETLAAVDFPERLRSTRRPRGKDRF